MAHTGTAVAAALAALAMASACSAQGPRRCEAQLTYASDKDAAYRYLEDRQHAIYDAFPGIADPFSRAELDKPRAVRTFADLSDRLSSLGCDSKGKNCVGDRDLYRKLAARIRCTPLTTRYESPLFLVSLNMLREQLEAVQRREYPGTPQARFGSLPGGAMDGETLLPPGAKDPVAILNRDVFYFTGAFSKAVSDAVPIGEERGMVALSYDPAAIDARLRANPHIVHNFADAMTRLVRDGTSRGAQEVMLDEDHARLHARLVTAMDMFIVAHEQAHAIRGHVGPGVTHRFQGALLVDAPADGEAATAPEVTLVARSRAQELEADELGLRLYVQADATGAADPVGLMVGAASANVVFRVLDAADGYRRDLTGRSFHDSNHPTAVERQAAVDVAFSELAQSKRPLAGLPDFRLLFGGSLDRLLVHADPLIRAQLKLPPAQPARP